MTVPGAVRELVERFYEQRESYHSIHYNEAQLRQEFLNPLFEALGWDVTNKKGYSAAYKEVIHEAAIKVGGRTKAPDYCFRVGGGAASFFVEAKQPAVDIGEAISPAYQLRRYAWSAKLPISILTDFEELAVYDCHIRPAKNDKATTARILLFTYQDYLVRWDELHDLLAPESIRRGALDRFVTSTKVKKGTAEVDAAFLSEIEGWRDSLARNLAIRNLDISQRDLNFAVQRTIDRIVFLRICEDRGIEPYGTLQALLNGSSVYRRLVELFRRADERYNSGLFHFTSEPDRAEPPDEFALGLNLDDKPLKQLIEGLYYPESPYEFSVLPTEILGQVYEQFLGKVIRLTKGHQAKVEEKPEVRKAGGVYYTPIYIVDYIVRQTVGQLLQGKSPAQASQLTVLDPACGSGSFLIGAYQHLLDWHRDQYLADEPEKLARGRNPRLCRSSGGDWRLTTAERKRILLNNIYGVDIDPQAVEVTKLSMLLKVLEGQSKESVNNQLRLFHERALPDLGQNIKCGNSLIGPGFYTKRQLSLLDEGKRLRVNAFDWRAKFPKIFRRGNGGFDAVVGNPPYVNAWSSFATSPEVRDYINLAGTFATAERHWDLYVLFLEQGLKLLRDSGRLAFIIPFSYAIQKYAAASRKMVLEASRVVSIADLRTVRVFGRVPVITIIPVMEKDPPPKHWRIQIHRPGPDATKTYAGAIGPSHTVRQAALLAQHEHMLRLDLSDAALALCSRVEQASITVGDICWVNYGAQMSSKEKGGFGKEHVLRDRKETRTCFPTISGRNLYRYALTWAGRYVEWALADQMYGPRERWFFETPKLMIRDLTGTHRLELTIDRSRMYCDHTVLCALRYTDIRDGKPAAQERIDRSAQYSLELIQALLASRLVSAYYYLKLTGEGVRTGGGFHTYPQTIRQLPLYRCEFAGPRECELLELAEQTAASLGALHDALGKAGSDHDKTSIQRQINGIDLQIDKLVYQLYQLTDDEIRIVEEATSSPKD
ncbi:MAG: N-6 DNA methylase [Planctomycetota bacterium]|nr:N-6 DNA methylase [Planctomycetota bacterium]